MADYATPEHPDGPGRTDPTQDQIKTRMQARPRPRAGDAARTGSRPPAHDPHPAAGETR